MTSPGGTGPTLSQVRTWDTEHLLAAASHWTETATVWEHHFSHFATQISFPGGELWEGEAAEAAQQMAHSDKMIVIALADQLHSASAIAKAGEREINEARRGVLKIVEAAEEAGYTVGEDFSVTDPNFYDRMTAAARQAHAEAIATSLRAAVGTLVASDVRVADELLSSTTGLGSNVFPEEEDGPMPGSVGDTIRLVNSYEKDGGPTSAPEPSPASTPGPNGQETLFRLWGLDVSKEDSALEAAGGVGGVAFDSARKAAFDAMKAGPTTGPGAPDPGMMKWLEEKKLKVGALELPLYSRMGGLASVALSVPGVFADHAQGDSWAKSIGQEAAGVGAGLLASGATTGAAGILTALLAEAAAGSAIGSVVPGVGTAVGLVGGLVVGGWAAMGMSDWVADSVWEPAADVVGDVIDGVGIMGNNVKTFLFGNVLG